MKRIVLSSVLVLLAFSAGAEAQTAPPVKNMFKTLAECEAALASGRLRFYEPKYLGLTTRNPTNNQDRIVVPLESDTCLEMQVVGGRRFVAQREGTRFRAQKLADGSQVLYARDDCGNQVYGVVYPPPVSAPAPQPVWEPAIVVPPLVYRDPPPVPVRAIFVEREKKKGGFCSSKKCRLTVLLIAGGAGYGAYRYYTCPPGTVRK